MSTGPESQRSTLESLSACCDGELDSASLTTVCAAWREDASVRARWHAYQLIGDVLRSDNLARRAAADAAFLITLRQRLAAEPTVLAPQPLARPQSSDGQSEVAVLGEAQLRRRSWWMPSTVAAGFVLVVGAVLMTHGLQPRATPADALMARAGAAASMPSASATAVAVPLVAVTEADFEPPVTRATGKLIRDSRLDRYLAAHQEFTGTTALGVPSGFLRNAVAEMPNH